MHSCSARTDHRRDSTEAVQGSQWQRTNLPYNGCGCSSPSRQHSPNLRGRLYRIDPASDTSLSQGMDLETLRLSAKPSPSEESALASGALALNDKWPLSRSNVSYSGLPGYGFGNGLVS